MFLIRAKNIVSAKFEAIKVRAETAETAGTTERILILSFVVVSSVSLVPLVPFLTEN